MMRLNCQGGELEEKGGGQKIPVFDQVNEVQQPRTNSDSFRVDIESSSHLIEKETNPNSRISMQRSLSRKGYVRGGEKKINPTVSILATSSTATLHGGSTPDKPVALPVGATNDSIIPQVHHQITINNGSVGSTAESKRGGKKYGFPRSPPTWSIDPRRILLFFATLSSMGTILLIYFTLSMGKLHGNHNGLN